MTAVYNGNKYLSYRHEILWANFCGGQSKSQKVVYFYINVGSSIAKISISIFPEICQKDSFRNPVAISFILNGFQT